MRRKARVDSNHTAVIQALRSCGWYVRDTSKVGDGFPDAIAAKHGRLVLVEIKDGEKPPSARKLTKGEAAFHASMQAAGVPVKVLMSVEEAVRL